VNLISDIVAGRRDYRPTWWSARATTTNPNARLHREPAALQSPACAAKGGSRQSSRDEYPDAHKPDSRADRVMAPSFPRVL